MLGNVREVVSDYVLTEDESKFYIPAYLIEKYDGDVLCFKIGDVLCFKIDGDEAKSKFMIAAAPV
jgi:hypothetical protein